MAGRGPLLEVASSTILATTWCLWWRHADFIKTPGRIDVPITPQLPTSSASVPPQEEFGICSRRTMGRKEDDRPLERNLDSAWHGRHPSPDHWVWNDLAASHVEQSNRRCLGRWWVWPSLAPHVTRSSMLPNEFSAFFLKLNYTASWSAVLSSSSFSEDMRIVMRPAPLSHPGYSGSEPSC